jgi:hypothetical protein
VTIPQKALQENDSALTLRHFALPKLLSTCTNTCRWEMQLKHQTCLVLLTVFAIGCGYGSKYNAPMSNGGSAPNIQTLMPNSATAGGMAFTLTVNGSGFSSSSGVVWNGVAHSTTFVTSNRLTAQISASDIATAGMIPVKLHATGGIYGNGVAANTVNFTVNP